MKNLNLTICPTLSLCCVLLSVLPCWRAQADTNEPSQTIIELQSQLAPPDSAPALYTAVPDRQARIAAGIKAREAALASAPPAEIELTSDGATARFGPHTVHFAPEAQDGISLITPDHLRLRSRVLGLFYMAEDGQSFLLAELQPSTGELIRSNAVAYPDAFSGAGVTADLVYEYTRSSFEQNVVLRTQVPNPTACGFRADQKVSLAVISEFVDAPEPRRFPAAIDLTRYFQALGINRSDTLSDVTLAFGSMRITAGKSFTLGEPDRAVPSGKAWQVIEVPGGKHRRFLIEFTPYDLLEPLLETLPVKTAQITQPPPAKRIQDALLQLKPASPSPTPRTLIAKLDSPLNSAPGVVLDYLMVNTPLLNIDFGYGGKSGFAAFGQQTWDYWNPYYYNSSDPGSLPDLYWSDLNPSTVGLVVSNAPGVGNNPLCLDPMYQYFIHPTAGGPITTWITNLPPDQYDIVVYATRASALGAPSFELKRSGVSLWKKHTTYWANNWYSSYWEEGEQFVRFRNIAITNQPIEIISFPDLAGYAAISGIQIIPSGAVPSNSPAISRLLNVDLASYSTNKVGFAAVGLTAQDFWNGFVPGGSYAKAETNLKWSDQTSSTVGMIVRNAPGAWGLTLPDPMLNSYIYSYSGENLSCASDQFMREKVV